MLLLANWYRTLHPKCSLYTTILMFIGEELAVSEFMWNSAFADMKNKNRILGENFYAQNI